MHRAAHAAVSSTPSPRVAIVGAGMAGASCARILSDAGLRVQVFDKSRGVGGRMATRRTEWLDARGQAHLANFDHGATGFTACSADFLDILASLSRDGLVTRWSPTLAPGSYAPLDEAALWVAKPDMPTLCRHWLADLPVQTSCQIGALQHSAEGWRLSGIHSAHAAQGAMGAAGEVFDHVVLAIPGAQAAPLLAPHHPAWAERAASLPLRPTWTMMAVTDEPRHTDAFGLAWPRTGELACIVRQDTKPGRPASPGLAHWVVHATTEFSETHLETSAPDVLAALQSALARWLGQPLQWHHAVAHRWRYASVQRSAMATQPASQLAWWSGSLGLGVCGDAFGGGGVEGAWVSGKAVAMDLLESCSTPMPVRSRRAAPFKGE